MEEGTKVVAPKPTQQQQVINRYMATSTDQGAGTLPSSWVNTANFFNNDTPLPAMGKWVSENLTPGFAAACATSSNANYAIGGMTAGTGLWYLSQFVPGVDVGVDIWTVAGGVGGAAAGCLWTANVSTASYGDGS